MQKIDKLFDTIRTFLSFYLPTVKKLSENTIDSYRKSLDLYIMFVSAFKNKPYFQVSKSDFNSENIVMFMQHLSEKRNNQPTTINLRLSNLKMFCAYLMKQNLIDQAILMDINEIKDAADERLRSFKWLTIEQTKILLSLPDLSKRLGLRDKFFMALLYDTGCRLDEILSMKCRDFKLVNENYAEVHVIGKGGKFRVTPVSDQVVPLYKDYMKKYHSAEIVSNPDTFLFYTRYQGMIVKMSADNAQRILKSYDHLAQIKDSDIPHFHPHLLRHTRSMHLYVAGVPLYLISEWLGHSKMETTQIYAQTIVEMKRDALKLLEEKSNAIFTDNDSFKYEGNDDVLKKLYGLKN